MARERTLVMWTPRERCTPEHCRQSVMPRLMEAHSGSAVPQSAQTPLPGAAVSSAIPGIV